MVRATRNLTASTADAPAAAATYSSGEIRMHHEGAAGLITLGSILDAYIFHEDEPFTWYVDGTNDGTQWFVIDTAAVLAHTSGGKGTSVSVNVPFAAIRIRVENTGAGTAPTFGLAAIIRDA